MGNIEDEHLTIKQLVSGGEQKVAGTTGRWSFFHAKTNVKLGGWYNASKSYMDCDESGTVTGLMSAHNMELRLRDGSIQWGNYTCAEHNLVFQTNTAITNGRVVSLATFNVSGTSAKVQAWEALSSSCLLEFNGLTSAANGVFDVTQQSANFQGSFKIRISGVNYWVPISSTAA